MDTLHGVYKRVLRLRLVNALTLSVFRWALLLALVWQIMLTLIGAYIDPTQGIFGHMIHWDAGWYLHLLEYGYSLDGSPAAPAFYPLFPVLVKFLDTITFHLLPLEVISLVINTICLWLALVALVKILQHFSINKIGITSALLLLLTFPSAFFMHVFYAEALFIVLGFWAYLFSLKRTWWAAGLLLALLTATKLPGVLFVLLCGLEYLRSYNWNLKKSINPKVGWLLLAPLGFVFYSAALYIIRGDAFAMMNAYKATNDWTYHVFNINVIDTLLRSTASGIKGLIETRAYEHFINKLLPMASIATIFISSMYLLYKKTSDYLPLVITGMASIIMFSLNSNVISVHRYALACICIYVGVALLCQTPKRLAILVITCLASAFVQLFIYIKFINEVFAG